MTVTPLLKKYINSPQNTELLRWILEMPVLFKEEKRSADVMMSRPLMLICNRVILRVLDIVVVKSATVGVLKLGLSIESKL